jgi:hypothetical protein
MRSPRTGAGAPSALGSIVLALAFTSRPAAAQAPLDQLAPGPYAVADWDWNFGNFTTTHPTTGNPYVVSHYGRLSYPSDGSGGANPPLAAGGPFPLVVFGHGRFQTGSTLWNNHLEAAYLMQRLASWGVVATSVNLDVVGSFSSPAAIPQRGDLFMGTLTRTLDLASQPGTPPAGLIGGIDGTRIAFAGHSRGGEGAVSGYLKNLALAIPYPILAIGTIAPTDFEGYQVPDVPYMGLYGSKDGDVNNGWPIYLHDRAASSEKAFEYVWGANHFWFTEHITCSCEGNADISRALHHDIAMGYLGGFLVRQLTDPALSSAVFCGGVEMQPLTAQATILPLYRDPARVAIDDFQLNPGLGLTAGGLPAVAALFVAAGEGSLKNTALTFYHETKGLNVSFNNGTDAIWTVALIDFDASGWGWLSGKFAQRQGSSFNAPSLPQDVSLGLMDTSYNLALVKLSDWGSIPYPKTHSSTFTQNFPKKTVLATTRVPLAAFSAANPALDLSHLLLAGWITDQTAQGEIAFDDLEFTQ